MMAAGTDHPYKSSCHVGDSEKVSWLHVRHHWLCVGAKEMKLRTNMIHYLHCTFRYKDELRVSPSVFEAAQAYEPLLSRSSIVRCKVSVFSPVILIPCVWNKEDFMAWTTSVYYQETERRVIKSYVSRSNCLVSKSVQSPVIIPEAFFPYIWRNLWSPNDEQVWEDDFSSSPSSILFQLRLRFVDKTKDDACARDAAKIS